MGDPRLSTSHPAAPSGRTASVLQAVILAIAILGVMVGALVLFSPTTVAYTVDGDQVHVQAELWPLDESRSLRVASAEARTLGSGYRVRGTGRGDYCSGIFWYDDIGEVWQATRCTDEVVLLVTDQGPVVIAPEDRAAFLSAVDAHQHQVFEAAPPEAGIPRAILLMFGGLLLGLIALLFVTLRRASGISYEVDAGVLSVPGMIGRMTIPLHGARVWRDPPRRRLWLRVFGTGMPGLHLGRYRGDGRSLWLSATQLFGEMVMIESGERRYAVTPADPAKLEAALIESGAVLGAPPEPTPR